ncbi:imidazole glycerol phosphate synthase subunit HisH [Rhodospirillum rubrum]|uniref:imidazole glycerol phosphate synthase subunit HisH n=1 Tax=Rhodospirillum rubrum TaxID=1085 RepID=UPI0019040002|nr:imidazole glycerol phosphate synthase subunit HisH [Rhodospirillum rubrum]MBK1664194.1 imidazole glycerol phosphate synthase subunit HisH [Rhodospirillum rubrum]MBK1678503.1 imidazole glycerol phosphate synthase subunit HisH [Rhodospirillum rubrum]
MRVALIDYGSGNLRSAAKALERAARDGGVAAEIAVTRDIHVVLGADRVVLPGVGAFADCRRGLQGVDGMVEALTEVALVRARPFLGICVGMQLLADEGVEYGPHPGLGWIGGAVEAISPADPALKIPHMGWNSLDFQAGCHPLLAGIEPGTHVYFVHSYHFRPTDPANRLASVEYGGPLTAMIGRGNLVGTQFHPEKSQAAGLRLIANFLRWTP